jgi:hypothetical protein
MTDTCHHTLDIAGIRVSLDASGLPPAAAAGLWADYAPFLRPADGDPAGADLHITLAVEPGPWFLPPIPGETWRIATRQAGSRLLYTSHYEQGWLDLPASRGFLLLRPQGQVENFLRVAYAALAPGHHALLLHAGGVILDGRGYVCFGHSGAGKSTITALAPARATVLSDDLVLLRLHRSPTGSRPQVFVHGVPFRGESLQAPRPNLAAPLAALCTLQQAPSHLLTRLSPAEATARLLTCLPFLTGDPTDPAPQTVCLGEAFTVCRQVAHALPICTLAFAPHASVWELLAGPPPQAPTALAPEFPAH